MTPGNEPLSLFFPFINIETAMWSSFAEAIFSADYLAPTFSEARYDIVYMAMDDQRFEIPWFDELLFINEKAKKLFNGTALHSYLDAVFSTLLLDESHNMFPDKFILITEACIRDENKIKEFGSWERGEKYMSYIIENLLHWTVGWVDWNLAIDKNGGPNWAKNYVDSPIIVIPEYDEFYKQPMYYALQHVSKFVPPNTKNILSTIKGLKYNMKVNAIAFLTPEKNVVVVIMNK